MYVIRVLEMTEGRVWGVNEREAQWVVSWKMKRP